MTGPDNSAGPSLRPVGTAWPGVAVRAVRPGLAAVQPGFAAVQPGFAAVQPGLQQGGPAPIRLVQGHLAAIPRGCNPPRPSGTPCPGSGSPVGTLGHCP